MKESDNTLVTTADYASEQADKAVLRELFPDAQILGKEYGLDGRVESNYLFHDLRTSMRAA